MQFRCPNKKHLLYYLLTKFICTKKISNHRTGPGHCCLAWTKIPKFGVGGSLNIANTAYDLSLTEYPKKNVAILFFVVVCFGPILTYYSGQKVN